MAAEPRPILRRDFLDRWWWAELARRFGLKLPNWRTPCTAGRMEAWLRKLGISRQQYLSSTGESSLKQFPQVNPDWPLRAWVGLLLERKAETEIS